MKARTILTPTRYQRNFYTYVAEPTLEDLIYIEVLEHER